MNPCWHTKQRATYRAFTFTWRISQTRQNKQLLHGIKNVNIPLTKVRNLKAHAFAWIKCKNWNNSQSWKLSMVAFWFWPGLSPPGSGRTLGCTCTHTSSRALSSALSRQRPAEGGSPPASCRQTNDKQWHSTVKSLCSYVQCTAGACSRRDASDCSYKGWELTLRCWKPAGSSPCACWGWGLSTRTRQGRTGAPRRRRLCRLSNLKRSSGCSPPV